MNTATMAFRGITLASIMVLAVTTAWLLEAKRTEARSLTRSEIASIWGGFGCSHPLLRCVEISDCQVEFGEKCMGRDPQSACENNLNPFEESTDNNDEECGGIPEEGQDCDESLIGDLPCKTTYDCEWDPIDMCCEIDEDSGVDVDAPSECEDACPDPSPGDPPSP